MISWLLGLFKKEATEPKLIYTWNGLNPEVIRNNWKPGYEYWVLVWWKDFLNQSIYLRSIDPTKERTMTNVQTATISAAEVNAFLSADDAAFNELLATKPASEVHDGPTGDVLGYLTDEDEADKPTIH